MAFLLPASLSQYRCGLAAVPQPAGVGRIRGIHLSHRFAAVLVRRDLFRIWRRCATGPRIALAQVIYGALAMGWRGSAVHWSRYETASILLAGLATPLVVSVHTVVSFDFSVAIVPGWHSTIFPPYFVAGAIYSGFAMVLRLAIPLRKFYHLEDFITMRHLDNMAKVMLATGVIVAYGYMMEAFMAFYSGNQYRPLHDAEPHDRPLCVRFTGLDRLQHRDSAGTVVAQGSQQRPELFVVALIVNCGMWLERFVIVVISLHRDYIPSSWGTVRTHPMGLGDLCRIDRLILDAVLSLHSFLADDFDRRDANAWSQKPKEKADANRSTEGIDGTDLSSQHELSLAAQHLRRRRSFRAARSSRSTGSIVAVVHRSERRRASSQCRSAISIMPASSESIAVTVTPRSRNRRLPGFRRPRPA